MEKTKKKDAMSYIDPRFLKIKLSPTLRAQSLESKSSKKVN